MNPDLWIEVWDAHALITALQAVDAALAGQTDPYEALRAVRKAVAACQFVTLDYHDQDGAEKED